ncbi:MAG: hypothetical protein NT029_02715 [Armatimonadetes bacterium]|nr:hypothetical protein [Armatimonadota bacterium]
MRVHSIPAPDGQTFPCSRGAVEASLGPDRPAWLSFGAIGRRFEFDTRARHRPELSGTVVAALSRAPDSESHLCLYPIADDEYGVAGKSAFAATVLPAFREWLSAQDGPSAAAISCHRQLIAEWTGAEHRLHEVQFLYQST